MNGDGQDSSVVVKEGGVQEAEAVGIAIPEEEGGFAFLGLVDCVRLEEGACLAVEATLDRR